MCHERKNNYINGNITAFLCSPKILPVGPTAISIRGNNEERTFPSILSGLKDTKQEKFYRDSKFTIVMCAHLTHDALKCMNCHILSSLALRTNSGIGRPSIEVSRSDTIDPHTR
jgi:hypothetical protein